MTSRRNPGFRLGVVRALLGRALRARAGRIRHRLWGSRPGFEFRAPATGWLGLVEDPAPLSPGRITGARPWMGIVVSEPESFGALAAARFYGLQEMTAHPGAAGALLARAAAERWPLVALAVDHEVPTGALASGLRRYLAAGGTVFLEMRAVGLEAPGGDRLFRKAAACVAVEAGLGSVEFSGRRPDLAHEFAGVRIEGVHATLALSPPPGSEVVATLTAPDGQRRPVVWELLAAGGRLVVAAGGALGGGLGASYSAAGALPLLPAMMLVRSLYGEHAWHPPERLANFSIDDPALRPGRLGLDYGGLVAAAREYDFHVTVATIPGELDVADLDTLSVLARNPRHVTACYHGNDHDGYEFYLPSARRHGYRARPLPGQVRALRQANARGSEFARRTGYALDRVMVFPYGIGPAAILDSLRVNGFLASCNFDDRFPLAGPLPGEPDLGLRPADVYGEWSGFPLLWRRGLPDCGWIFDLFAGRPALTFAHPKKLDGFLPFIQRSEEVRRVGQGAVRWCGLEDIARHAYLQRRRADGAWEVRMLSNEICLHNPGSQARAFVVRRPHAPLGAYLVGAAAAAGASAGAALRLTAPASGTAVVSLWAPDQLQLPRRQGCTLIGSGAEEEGRTVPPGLPKSPADNHAGRH